MATFKLAVTVEVVINADKIGFDTRTLKNGTVVRYLKQEAIESAKIAKVGGDFAQAQAHNIALALGPGIYQTQLRFMEAEKPKVEAVKPASVDSFDMLANPMEGFNIGEPSPREKFVAKCREKGIVGNGTLPEAILAKVKELRGTMDDKQLHAAVNAQLAAMNLPTFNGGELKLLEAATK